MSRPRELTFANVAHSLRENPLVALAGRGGSKLMGILGTLLTNLSNRVILEDDTGVASVHADFVDDVEKARREWLAAKAYFETVSDPDLVDHAIHLVTAAEKKYTYLLRLAREQGIQMKM